MADKTTHVTRLSDLLTIYDNDGEMSNAK